MNAIVDALVHHLDENNREAFEERAGILQWEAGKDRELAEALALLDVIRQQPLAVAGVVCLRSTAGAKPVWLLASDTQKTTARLSAYGVAGAVPADLAGAVSSLGGAACLTAL